MENRNDAPYIKVLLDTLVEKEVANLKLKASYAQLEEELKDLAHKCSKLEGYKKTFNTLKNSTYDEFCEKTIKVMERPEDLSKVVALDFLIQEGIEGDFDIKLKMYCIPGLCVEKYHLMERLTDEEGENKGDKLGTGKGNKK